METLDSIRYRLEKLDYSLFELEGVKTEELIIDLIKSKNLRYIKSIPFILWRKPVFDIAMLSKFAEKNSLKEEVNLMLYAASNVFKQQNLNASLIDKYLQEHATKKELTSFEKLRKGTLDNAIKKLKFKISSNFLNEAYKDFLMHKMPIELKDKTNLLEQISKFKELDIQFALSKLFKNKQKEIIRKILNEQQLTKTEYEYYIRIIKKKLDAITQLNEIATRTLRKAINKI